MTKRVQFAKDLVIYEFPIEIGDNPVVSSGCPIAMGRKHHSKEVKNFDFYEISRHKEQKRSIKKLTIPVERRCLILLRSGYSIEKIAKATLKAEQVKLGRIETLRKSGWSNFAMALEAGGKIPKGILKSALGTTGDIIQNTMATGGMFIGGVGKQLSKTFGSSKPKTLQARSA